MTKEIIRARPKATWPPKATELTTAMADVAATVIERPPEPVAILATNTGNWINRPPQNKVCKPADYS